MSRLFGKLAFQTKGISVDLVEALSLMADHTRFPSETMQQEVKAAIVDTLTIPEPLTDDADVSDQNVL